MSDRAIRRVVTVYTVVLLALCVAPSGAQEKKKAPAAAAPKSLEERLKDYQDENAVLRRRVRELESQVENLKQNRTVTITPQPGQSAVPQNWRPFQFNGATYYVVPLDATSTSGQGTSGQGTVRLLTDAGAELDSGQPKVTAPTPTQPTPPK